MDRPGNSRWMQIWHDPKCNCEHCRKPKPIYMNRSLGYATLMLVSVFILIGIAKYIQCLTIHP